MASETELATQVMRELGLLASEEAPTAAEAADILTRYYQQLLMLTDEDYADWTQGPNVAADVIPDAAMPGTVQIIAYECAPMFGIGKSQLVDRQGRTWRQLGEIALRRYMRKKPSYEPVMADYF
jgi:hypothetical protein